MAPYAFLGDAAMSTERLEQAKAILRQLVDRNPDQREAWLEGACRDDAELRREVETLLQDAVTNPTRPFLDTESVVAAAPKFASHDPDTPFIGKLVGPYKITRELGRGGMGAVYLAER